MSQITKTAKSAMILTAGAVAGVLLAGSAATTANAETIYYGYETSFREAKQMCNGIHGRIFETERGQYACAGEPSRPRRKIVRPQPEPAGAAPGNRPSKRQNFAGRTDFTDIGQGGGNGGNNGGDSGKR
ncbi:MAG: hypothetical protein AAF299_02230 [Pseudomonadota bacterium]